MALNFAQASTQYLTVGSAVANVPLTMACWYRRLSYATSQCLMGIGVVAANSNRIDIGVQGTDEAWALYSSGTARIALSSTTITDAAWHHVCGVFPSTNSRTVYLDGGGAGTESTAASAITPDTTRIGLIVRTPNAGPADGDIAEAAIWDVALTAAEVAILAAGFSPLFVRPGNLVAYWPLLDKASPSIDRIGSVDLTWTSGPTVVAHSRVIYPHRRGAIFVPAAAAAGRIMGSLAGHGGLAGPGGLAGERGGLAA